VILSGRISADTLGHLWQDIRQAQSQWLMQTTGSKTLANGLQQALATILQNYENDLYAGTKNLPRPLGQQKLLGK
jgi:hypothetical protein